MLGVSGCVEPVGNYGYGAMPGPGGMPYQAGGFGYDNYGQPYTVVDGQPTVIIFEPNLGWGYYDSRRHWQAAPSRLIGPLERQYPRGYGLPPLRPLATPGVGVIDGHFHQGVRPPSPMAEHPQGQPSPMWGRPQGQPNPMEGRPQSQPNQWEGRPQTQPNPMWGHPQGQPNPMEARPQAQPNRWEGHPQFQPNPMVGHPQGGYAPMPAPPSAGTPPARPGPQGGAPRNQGREIKR